MTEILRIFSYIIPSVVVFLTAWLILREFFRQEQQKRNLQIQEERQKITLPVRLQAYERLVLFLERISPGNLVMRVHKPNLTVKQFQQMLIQNIRDEFDHNLSQQLYISPEAWERVKGAKEEMLRQINTSAARLPEDSTSTDLSKGILGMSIDKSATRKALDFIKAEASRII